MKGGPVAGTLRIDNTSGTQGDTVGQRGFRPPPPPVWDFIDPSAIVVGSYRDYTVPAGTYTVAVAFGPGPVQQFAGNVVTDGNTTTVTLP